MSQNSTKKNRAEHQVHTIEPFYRPDSHVLILGSFPSVKSRESGFFYGHPQNRFWKMAACICGETELSRVLSGEPVFSDIEEKKAFLERNHIAMWDTIASCTIIGSSDSSIRDVVPNDLNRILTAAPIRKIFCNGATSWNLYRKYCFPETKREAEKMPSTSPANAAWSLEKLCAAWSVMTQYLQNG